MIDKEKLVRITFYEYLNRDIGATDLERFIYENNGLEYLISQESYVDLISYPFTSGHLHSYIFELVRTYFDRHEYELWRTINVLQDFVNDKIEIVLASRKLYNIYREQEESLDSCLISIELGVGFYSVMDECPIESEYGSDSVEYIERKQQEIIGYRERMKKLALVELGELVEK